MLVLKERITNVPIMSLQTGAELARAQRPVIDPRSLIVVAFYCRGQQLDIQPAILHIEDIREVSTLGFIVDSADVLMGTDDLVRLKTIIEYDFALEGKQVVENTGRKVGKVVNYTVDTNTFYITQLHVQPSLLRAWGTSTVLIGRQQILEIHDSKIVVAAPTIRDAAPAKAHSAIAKNPFRRGQPQAEAHSVVRDEQG